MGSDSIKLYFTYLIVLVILIGGGLFLFFTRLDPTQDDLIKGAVIGFIGAAVQFVFNHETATRAQRQTESALGINNTAHFPPVMDDDVSDDVVAEEPVAPANPPA